MKRKFLFAAIICFSIAVLTAAFGHASSQTTNLKLNKPGKGDRNWGQTVNDNMDKIDSEIATIRSKSDDLPEVYVYTGTFNSTTGTQITLPKAVDNVNEYAVKVTPTSRAGAIGDIYVSKTTSNFTVKCSEANTTDTFSVSVYYIGDVSSYGSSIYRKWYVSPATSITDYADSSQTGSLAWVQSQIGGVQAAVELVGNKTYQIKQNLTIVDTIQLKFQNGAIIDTDISIRDSNYEWYLSGSGTNEYYLQASGGGNPNVSQPAVAIENNEQMAEGNAGSLSAGEWDWNDNDFLGYTTIYVRLSDSTDPDSKSADYVEAGYTLALNLLPMAGAFQLFSGHGNVTISGRIESVWFASLNQAVKSGAKKVHITPGVTHTITATCPPSSGQTIYGDGDQSLVEFGANIDAFTIDGKTNIIIRDFKIDGKKATYTTTSNNAISSPANGTGSSNIRIEGMTIVGVAGNSIEILSQAGSHSENIKILNNFITDSGGCGIIAQDYVDDVMIRGNRIINYALGVSSTTGIASGRDAVNTQIIDNYVEDGGSSLGASPHGISIDTCTNGVVANNIVKGARGYGIEVGFSSQTSVTGNEIYSTTKAGIAVSGDDSTSDVCKHVSIVGNTIFEPGAQGIYAYVSNYVDDEHEDITIVGNTIHNAQAQEGIYLQYVNNGNVSGNTIVDSYKSGVLLSSCNYIVANGNLSKNSDTSATAAAYYGVSQISSTFCIINGVLEINTDWISTSGTGEDTLGTITIPQYFYTDWHGLRLTAAGTKTGAAGNKTIKLHIGASSYTFNAAANDTNDWRITSDMIFHNFNRWRTTWLGWNGATPLQGYEDNTSDLSVGDIVLKITGECADGADTITQTVWKLEVF